MFVGMTMQETYKLFLNSLKDIYSESEAAAIADIVFKHFTGLSRFDIVSNSNEIVSQKSAALLEDALQALMQHIPVQQVTGTAWFLGLEFTVSKDVLIPRPETEELVSEAINILKDFPSPKIIEIGTGSGCIAVSLKKNIPSASIVSIDISAAALEIAGKNAAKHHTDITFLKADFLDETAWADLSLFDAVISNPPYIPEGEKSNLDKNVLLHEPHTALFVPQDDALLFYKKIRRFSEKHLKENGKVFLEIHEHFGSETTALFNDQIFTCEVKKDMSGKDRMLHASRFH